MLRGDGHFANPELMALSVDDPHTDFVFGLTGNAVLTRLAEAPLAATRALQARRCGDAKRSASRAPARTRTYHELDYAARSWTQPARVILKAEVTARGDNPRYVVTSLDLPSPEALYRDLYCARGQDENFIKAMKNDLACDRTSSPRFLANQRRLFFAAAAYVLHHSLRSEALVHTELADAQPATVITKLFKIAVRVVVYHDRVKRQPRQGVAPARHRDSLSLPPATARPARLSRRSATTQALILPPWDKGPCARGGGSSDFAPSRGCQSATQRLLGLDGQGLGDHRSTRRRAI